MNARVLVGVPCMGTLPAPTVQCLLDLRKAGFDIHLESMSLVYVSRERIVEKAILEKYDYVFFLDSDMVIQPAVLKNLLKADKDMITALAFMRSPPYSPCIYDVIRVGAPGENQIHQPRNWEDDIIEVDGCGAACLLVRTKVFDDVRKKHGLCFTPGMYLGEDLSFCVRARQLGYKIFCDTRERVGHLGTVVVTEDTWHQWHGT